MGVPDGGDRRKLKPRLRLIVTLRDMGVRQSAEAAPTDECDARFSSVCAHPLPGNVGKTSVPERCTAASFKA